MCEAFDKNLPPVELDRECQMCDKEVGQARTSAGHSQRKARSPTTFILAEPMTAAN